MTDKATAVFLATMLAAPLSVAWQGIAFGKDKGKSGHDGGGSTKLYAKFTTVALEVTLPEEFKARVKYEKKSNSKGTEEEIEAKVGLALPPETSLDPLVDTTGYLVRVLSGTTDKGSCVLLAKAIELEYESGVLSEFDVHYAAKVKEKTPTSGPPSTLKSKVGDCWSIPAAPATPGRGVPDIVEGDIVELYSLTTLPTIPLAGNPAVESLLSSGVFQKGHDHGDDDDDDD
jgi:hypothetical protein